MLEFVRARPGEALLVLEIQQEAARWLLARGNPQWSGLFTPEGARKILRRVNEEEAFLVRQNGQPVGTLCLQWQDVEFWGETGADGQAGYVHGLAIRREAGGRGVGQRLVAWAEALCAARLKRYLRLDCRATNQALCAYYLRQGFEPRGVREFPGWPAQLFEKRLPSG